MEERQHTDGRTMQTESAPSADDVDGWLQRSIDCVTCDGRADTRALDVVQFAHDLAVARKIMASIRADGLSDNIVLGGIRVPHPHNARKSPVLRVMESSPGSGEWHALVGTKPHTRGHVLGSDVVPLNGDVVSALLALSARSRTSPFETIVAQGEIASSEPNAWLVRMARALALRSTPWDLAAVDQEVGLARTLIEVLAARRSSHFRPVRVSLTCQGLSAADASAYTAAIALWDRHGIVLDNTSAPLHTYGDDPVYGLRVFAAAAERMQATPGFYLALVAPAIAARLQPGLDALGEAAAESTDSVSREQ
ncbi:hypothetical protein pkur_cds_384 [Pandoravirus kuranda]|uniref:Uncharacterized protein n=1 Tax=Pandoravirus kuranda TaxID=3019033 RepID=A0AA95EIE6_9VIRU|nr:hypothetical protein pkur_cds_384 [Pandoravirus kuranda]